MIARIGRLGRESLGSAGAAASGLRRADRRAMLGRRRAEGRCRAIASCRRGHVFLLIGPSGSGKTTLIQALRRRAPEVAFLPTTTTRAPRPGETDGVEYHFTSDSEFDRALAAGDFFEWQPIHGHRYGSSRRRFAAALEAGRVGITSLDILGGLAVKAAMGDRATTIFVRPSSLAVLRDRLLGRGDTGGDDLERRLQRAEMEIAQAARCDFILINDDLEAALDQLTRIVAPFLAPCGEAEKRSGAPRRGAPGPSGKTL
jgi:guanylate kinase